MIFLSCCLGCHRVEGEREISGGEAQRESLGCRQDDYQLSSGRMGIQFALLFFSLTSLKCLAYEKITIFNAADFGAHGDRTTDNSAAFQRAWTVACSSSEKSAQVLIPSTGSFLLNRISFSGPCKPYKIKFQVEGEIIAPNGLWTTDLTSAWITFIQIKGLMILGSGKIDGRGSKWWACRIKNECGSAPDMLAVESCDWFYLGGVHFLNSPAKHVTIYGSQWVMINGISVSSPRDSPNTDGLMIQECKHVQIVSCNFASGDDCVAIGTGSYDVNVSSITCGPGHGVSVGSLGIGGTRAEVENVHVTSSHFFNTMYGVRIKTWSGGSGFARGIIFENNEFSFVVNPIIIDQYYCGGASGCENKTSAVEIRDVKYIGLTGTSTGEHAIRLECSNNVPCNDILLDNVVIKSAVKGERASSFCYNAHGRMMRPVIPQVLCLSQ